MPRLKHLRRLSQFFFVALLAYIGVRHQIVGGGPSGAAPIDSYCVFGGVETLFSWITTGAFLAKTAISNLILLGALLLSVLLIGSAFCGWICPLGAIQEFLGAVGRKILRRQIILPPKIDRILQYLKYPVLIGIIALTIVDRKLWFETYDPFKVLFHFSFETLTAYWVLFGFLGLALLIDRFWCKYLCPLSAVITPLSKLSLFSLKRDHSLCTNCNACSITCTVHKLTPGVQGVFTNSCTLCLECVDACKTKQALGIKVGYRTLRPAAKTIIPLTALLVFSLTISLTVVSGLWNTRPVAGEIKLETNGQVSSDDIKGWMTLSDLSLRYQKQASELLTGLGWDLGTDLNTPLKDLAKGYGTDVEALKPQLQKLLNKK